MMRIIKCPACWNEIDSNYEICPFCGFVLKGNQAESNAEQNYTKSDNTNPWNGAARNDSNNRFKLSQNSQRIVAIIAVVLVFLVIVGINRIDSVDKSYDTAYSHSDTSYDNSYNYNDTYSYVVQTGTEGAVNKAKSYLNVSAFSYTGLVEQLEYEGFSHYEATYGADNCGADWKEQALLKAKSYLNSSAFSESGLTEQLEYEGFTSEQAKYGVRLCGTDWKEQAAKKAASYLKVHDFTRSELIDQQENEDFTYEQASYGAGHSGF